MAENVSRNPHNTLQPPTWVRGSPNKYTEANQPKPAAPSDALLPEKKSIKARDKKSKDSNPILSAWLKQNKHISLKKNHKLTHGFNALDFAIALNREDIVLILLSMGFTPQKFDYFAALQNKNPDLAKYLIFFDQPHEEKLMIAATAQNLIHKRIDTQSKAYARFNALDIAIAANQPESVQALLGEGITPTKFHLYLALELENYELAEQLIFFGQPAHRKQEFMKALGSLRSGAF